MVALRKESVDRNAVDAAFWALIWVALRKESVDRNLQKLAEAIKPSVALRKESVDRNLPARRAATAAWVALRKESVDRNSKTGVALSWIVSSLSARRAWIEIVMQEIAQQRKQRRSPQGERG